MAGIGQDLYVILLEYWMQSFEGAFHINPDYALILLGADEEITPED